MLLRPLLACAMVSDLMFMACTSVEIFNLGRIAQVPPPLSLFSLHLFLQRRTRRPMIHKHTYMLIHAVPGDEHDREMPTLVPASAFLQLHTEPLCVHHALAIHMAYRPELGAQRYPPRRDPILPGEIFTHPDLSSYGHSPCDSKSI